MTYTADTLVKVLAEDRMPMHGGSGQWPKRGTWRRADGDLVACRNGLHVCTIRQSLQWLGPELWTVEVQGQRIDEDDKSVVHRARLLARIDTWNERTARLFAADCAEWAIGAYTQLGLDDAPLRQAIETARAYANERATTDQLAAAESAAWSAAGSAAESAAGSAAWSAAESAARSAAESAAWSAAESAAESAAWSAAESAAESAAWSAAWSAAESAARDWQTDRLLAYLNGEAARP